MSMPAMTPRPPDADATAAINALVGFLQKPLIATGGDECDPDLITADNLAREAALKAIRSFAARTARATEPAS